MDRKIGLTCGIASLLIGIRGYPRTCLIRMIEQPKCRKPRNSMVDFSWRMQSLLKFWNQLIVRSTVQRRLYRRSFLPSCVVFSGLRLLRCGAISSMPSSSSSSSSASLSYALSPMIYSGASTVSMKSNIPCTSLDSCRGGAAGRDRDGETAGIDKHHDFHAFSGLGNADAISPAAGLAEGRIDEALVEAVAVALLDEFARIAHEVLEHTLLHPEREPAVDRALGTEPPRQVLPLRTVIKDPEDAAERGTLVDRGPPALGRDGRIGDTFGQPVELFIRESHRHAMLFAPRSSPVARFWDSLYALVAGESLSRGYLAGVAAAEGILDMAYRFIAMRLLSSNIAESRVFVSGSMKPFKSAPPAGSGLRDDGGL